jgi:hypothetical protein
METKENLSDSDLFHKAVETLADIILETLKYGNIYILIKDFTEEQQSGIIEIRERLVRADKLKGIYENQEPICVKTP